MFQAVKVFDIHADKTTENLNYLTTAKFNC